MKKAMLCLFEWMLAIALVGMLAISTVNAGTLKSVDALVVVDANGKKVGTVTDIGLTLTGAAVVFEVDGFLFALFITQGSFIGTFTFFQFESTDCTGTPFIGSSTGLLLHGVAVFPPGMTVYRPDPTATPRTITSRSEMGNAGSCIVITRTIPDRSPAFPLIDLSTLFTPPFSVKVATNQDQFQNHTHIYLTGIGEGHNNTEAITSPPIFE